MSNDLMNVGSEKSDVVFTVCTPIAGTLIVTQGAFEASA